MIGPTILLGLALAIAAVASIAFADEIDQGDPIRVFVVLLCVVAYLVALAVALSAVRFLA